jgi:hypothetical protein
MPLRGFVIAATALAAAACAPELTRVDRPPLGVRTITLVNETGKRITKVHLRYSRPTHERFGRTVLTGEWGSYPIVVSPEDDAAGSVELRLLMEGTPGPFIIESLVIDLDGTPTTVAENQRVDVTGDVTIVLEPGVKAVVRPPGAASSSAGTDTP